MLWSSRSRAGGRAGGRAGWRAGGRRAVEHLFGLAEHVFGPAEHVFMFGEQCSCAALQEKPKKDGRMENIFIVELA